MDRHCENARAVVELLDGHPAVDRVLYPGCPTTPATTWPQRQMRDFGGMVSFIAAGGEDAALAVVALAPSCSRWPSRSARSSR